MIKLTRVMVMIKINEIYEVKCIDMSFEALGVCKIDNFIVFVPNLITDETAVIKIIKINNNYGYGEIIELIKMSKYRNKDITVNNAGVQLLHILYDYQKKLKENIVKNIFKKILNKDIKVNKIIDMKEPYYYRNKIKVHLKKNNNKVIYGFYEEKSNHLIPIEKCIICSKRCNELLDKIINLLNKYKIFNIDEIIIKEGFNTNESMIIFICKKWIDLHNISEELKSAGITTVIQKINEKEKIIFGSGYIHDILDNIKFKISSRSFYQVNPVQTEKLYNKAIELADLNKDNTVIDAYSGIGTISLYLSKYVKKVYGIEIEKAAVADAIENSKINNINNVEFINGDVEKEIISFKDKNIDVVFIDPPRKGCSKSFLDSILEMKPKKIIYISCNATTQARDIRHLINEGYNCSEAYPVDMFPHTYHIENIIMLWR